MGLRTVFSVLISSAFLCSAAAAQPSVAPLKPFDISYLKYLPGGHSGLSPTMEKTYPRSELLQTVQDVCCPGGYPWYRQSTNMCYGSYEDCHDTNGGGWSCIQVNAC